MRQDAVLGPGHGVLADEENAVVQVILEIVVRRSRAALDQLRAGIDIGDGKTAAAVVTVPDHHLPGAGVQQAFYSRVQFAYQQPPAFIVAALAGQELLLGVVDSADALHIGYDQKFRLLSAADGAQKHARQYEPKHHNDRFTERE